MTNGEKIQAILDIDKGCTEVYGKNGMMTFSVPQDWWNAEYKESTTKNEVKYCDRNICLRNEYNNVGCEDCEVTKSQEPTTKNDLGADAVSREKVWFMITGGKYSDEDYEQFIDRLVNELAELPSVTPQPCEDAVSRQEVLDLIADYDLSMGQVVRGIHALPSVTPQPRKGHWKLVQRGKFIDVCCSNCKAVRIKEYAYNYTIDELNKEDIKEDINECFGSAEMRFCPNCGCRMVDQQESKG